MIQALLRGKLSRRQENMEDILTSSVFGLLSYLPAEKGLLPFLSKARAVNGREPRPLAGYLEEAVVESIQYWPVIEEVEPDVLIPVSAKTGARTLVMVEAKLHSGISAEQLLKEAQSLAKLARKTGARPVLVALTADVGMPRKPLGQAAEMPAGVELCWLSWRDLDDVLPEAEIPEPWAQVKRDLVALLERLHLRTFRSCWNAARQRGGWLYRFRWQPTAGDVELWRYTDV